MSKVGMISAQTPNFLISMDEVFGGDLGSTIEINPNNEDDISDYTILYDTKFSAKKIVAPDAGSDLFSSSRMQGSLLHVTIASGAYVTDLENIFVTGTLVQTTTIAKLANVGAPDDPGGIGVPVDLNVFGNCYIIAIAPAYDTKTNMDLFRMEIRYNTRTHTIRQYDQGGNLLGSNISVYDFTTNSTTLGSGDTYSGYDAS